MTIAFLGKTVVNTFTLPILYISLLFDVNFQEPVFIFFTVLSDALGYFYILVVIEICAVKYWIRFVWRAIRPIDDKFFCFSLTVINIFISLYWSFLTYMGGHGFRYAPMILDKVTAFELFGQSKPVKM